MINIILVYFYTTVLFYKIIIQNTALVLILLIELSSILAVCDLSLESPALPGTLALPTYMISINCSAFLSSLLIISLS